LRLSALRTDLETPTGAAEKKENLSFNPVRSHPIDFDVAADVRRRISSKTPNPPPRHLGGYAF